MDASGPTDDEHKEAGGDGIESAAVAYFTLIEATPNEVDDIVGCFAGGFIGEKEAVELGGHRNWIGTKDGVREWEELGRIARKGMGVGDWLRLQVGYGFTDGVEDELAIFFGVLGEADSCSGFMATSAKG